MNILSKKYIGAALGFAFALMLALPAVLTNALPAHASTDTNNGPLTAADLFGGTTQGDGAAFASEAGLSSGNLVDTISSIIRMALGFLGIIAVVIILLGGFKWMTAGGNDDKVKKAKALIFQGIIGLVIVLSSYAIASFVIESIITASAGAAE